MASGALVGLRVDLKVTKLWRVSLRGVRFAGRWVHGYERGDTVRVKDHWVTHLPIVCTPALECGGGCRTMRWIL